MDPPCDGRPPADARRHPCGHVPVPGVVRRASARGRGRRGGRRGHRAGTAGSRGAQRARRARRRSSSRRATPMCRSGRSSRCARSGRRSRAARSRSVAVSPLVGGKAVKGPADRMLSRMAGGTTRRVMSPSCYEGLIDVLVIDRSDAPADAPVELVVDHTLMTRPRRRRGASPRRCWRRRAHSGRRRARGRSARRSPPGCEKPESRSSSDRGTPTAPRLSRPSSRWPAPRTRTRSAAPTSSSSRRMPTRRSTRPGR